MKGSVKLIIASVVMLLLSATTLVFAWFTIVEKTRNIIIYSGAIKTEYSLIQTNSTPPNKAITKVETYELMLPGDQIDYVLTVTNRGNIDGLLTIVVNLGGTAPSSQGQADIREYFILRDTSGDKNFLAPVTIVEQMLLNPYGSSGTYTYVYNFSVIFDSSYEDKTFDQSAFIESIVITLEQADE